MNESKPTLNRKSISIWIYAIFLSALYGGTSAGQVLGFLGIYNTGLACTVTISLFGICLYLLHRHGKLEQLFGERLIKNPNFSSFDRFAALAGIMLIAIVLIVPLIRWPNTPLAGELTWDAGLYHFPKAIELYRTGSIWDLSIPYGQYPMGYESLLALGLGLAGNFLFVGWVHAAIAIFLCLTVWFLLRRYTRLPAGTLLLITGLILVCGSWISQSRLYLLTSYVQIVGKNDILLAGAVLSVILLSPISSQKKDVFFSPVALAVASTVSISVKVNGWGVLVLAWLALLMHWWRKNRNLGGQVYRRFAGIFAAGLLIIPGFLWAVRNLFVMGMVFSPGVRNYMDWSIGYNFTNPNLYAITPTFIILVAVLGLLVVSVAMSLKNSKPGWSTTLTLAILLLTFIYTPVSAFLGSVDEPAHIAWRFGVALLIFSVVVFVHLIEPWLLRWIDQIQRKRTYQLFGALLISVLLIFTIWNGLWLMDDASENVIILEDQFPQHVGVDGYYSAYEYVQRNIRDAVIQIENGLPIYLYGPGFTNTPTKLQYPVGAQDLVEQPDPDYYVIFRTNWQDDQHGIENDFPRYLETESWNEMWEIIYQDDQGRVYERR